MRTEIAIISALALVLSVPLAFGQTETVTGLMTLPEERVEEFTFEKFQDGYIWALDEDGFLYKEYNFNLMPVTPITGVTSFEAIDSNGDTNEFPETGVFQNHDNSLNDDGTYTLESHDPYIENWTGEYVPFRTVNNDDIVQIEFDGGKLVFDKSTGALTSFNNDGILIKSDSYVVRQAELNSNVWNNLDVNDSNITTSFEELDDGNVVVTFTRENFEGVYKIEHIVMLNKVKTTAYFTNNFYENSKFAFTQTLELPDSIISINDLQTVVDDDNPDGVEVMTLQEIDLSDYVGQSFPRQVLEENQDLILQIKDIYYNSGLGFDNLHNVSILENNIIALDYANVQETQTAIGQTVELDPTLSYSRSGTPWSSIFGYTHSFSSVSNADVSAFSISLTNTGSSSNFYHCNGCNIQAEIGVPNGSKDSCTDTVADSTYSSWKYWNSFSCNTSGGNYANIESALANGSMKATIKSGSYYSDNSVTSVYGSWSWSVTYSVPAVPDPVTPTATTANGQNTVTWTQPNDNGATIDQYDIYGNGVLLHSITNSPTTTTWVHTNPVAGTPIYYQVYSHNSVGWQINAPNSNTVTPVTAPVAPAVPTGTFVSNTSNTVTWTAPSNNGGSAVTGYQVFRNGVSIATVGNVLTYTDTGITNPSSNSYSVSAINAIGTGDQSGGSFPVWNGVAPTTPTSLSVTFNDPNGDLSWTASDNGSPYIESSIAKSYTNDGIVVPATWSLWQGGASPTAPTMGVTGVLGNAMEFDGVADMVGENFVSGFPNSGQQPTQASISIWVKPTASGSSVGNPWGGTGFQTYWITNTPLWSAYPSNSFNMGSLYSNANAFTMNQWNHVVVTIDSTTSNNITTVYVNGSPLQMYTYPSGTGGGSASNQNSKTAGNLVANTMLGGQYHPNPQFKYPFEGQIDEFSSWNKILSQSEVTTLYNSGNGNTPDSINSNNNIITYFPLDDYSANIPVRSLTTDPVTTTYSVERDNSQIATTTSTTYSDTPSLGSSYDYTVSASTTYGTSSDSNTATLDLTYPSAPTGLSTAYNDPNVDLTWTAPSSSGGSPITGYTIEHSTDNNTWTTLTTTSNTSVTYTHTSPVIGSLNYYKVSGVNTYGTGAVSNTSSVLAGVPPDAPSITSASYNNPANSNIEVAITNGASMGTGTFTQWNIERSADGSTNWTSAGTATTSPFTDTNVPSIGDWYYRATTQSNHGTSTYSANALASPVAPDVPTNLTSVISNPDPSPLTISLDWDSPINFGSGTLTGYEVYRDGSLITTTGTASQYDDTVTVQGTYVYTIKTVTTHAVSGLSGSTTISTPTQPSADSSVILSIDNPDPNPLDITVSLVAPSSNGGSAVTGYNIFSSPDDITYTLVSSNVNTAQTITVANSGTWYFKSQAINNVGTAAVGSAVSIATPTVPVSDSSVTLSIDNPNPNPLDITVSFVAPSSDGGSAVVSYDLHSSPDDITYTQIATGVTADQTVTVSSAGTWYFKSLSTNNVGSSALGSAVNITTPSVPTNDASVTLAIPDPDNFPFNSTATFVAPSSNGGSAVTGYNLYYSDDDITYSQIASASNSVINQTLTGAGTHYFKVESINNVGTSALSSAITIDTPTVPSADASATLAINNPNPSPLTITATFVAPSSDGGSAVIDYNLWISNDDVTYTQIATNVTGTYDTTVSQSGTYYFKVESTNLIGTAGVGSATSITTPTVPSSPLNASSTIGDVDTAPYEVTVTWETPSSTGGSDLTQYNVYRKQGSGAYSLLTTTTGLSITDTVPTSLSTNFTYKIHSQNNVGESTGFTDTTITTFDVPQAPTLSVTTGTTVLSWNTPTSDGTVTNYKIYRDGSLVTTVGAVNTHSDFTPIVFGNSYDYKIVAVSSLGDSADSNTVTTTPETEITGMIALGVTGTGAVIDWEEPAYYQGQVTSYNVYYGNSGTPTTSAGTTTNTYNNFGTQLDYDTTYVFAVSINSPLGNSGLSNIVTITTNVDGSIVTYDPNVGGMQWFDIDSVSEQTVNVIEFQRMTQDDVVNGTTVVFDTLQVGYPSWWDDMTCNVDYKFAQETEQYVEGDDMTAVINSANVDQKVIGFQFHDIENEVIEVECAPQVSQHDDEVSAKYIMTQQSFGTLQPDGTYSTGTPNIPLVTQVQAFQTGEYGTDGDFGALDIVGLFVILISMVGFNRLNPIVGVLLSASLVFGLSFFGIISLPTVLVGVVALVIFLAWGITRNR